MFPGRTVGSAQKVAISGEGQPGDDNSRDDCCEIPMARVIGRRSKPIEA
jgi:hypothetical protein